MLFTPMSCQEKKENTTKMEEEQFIWEGGVSAPIGYPVQIYQGSIGFKSISDVLSTGKYGWGSMGNTMNSGTDWMPRFLNVTWLSYAEDCMYTIETHIDHKKLFSLFKKGYEAKVTNGSGEIRHENYDGICAGFAPGGVVVIWAVGASRQTEIGRYQGKKIIIPQSEIDGLDSHEELIFDPEYRKMTMSDDRIISKEVQEANKNKPIPLGLWDTYRLKYNWKPVFILPDSSILNEFYEIRLTFLNGEVENIFSDQFPINAYWNKTILRKITFSFTDKNGIQYGAGADLNEESVLNAFKEIYEKNSGSISADLNIKINMDNTYFTVKLKGNGKDIFIKTEDLEVFKILK